MEFLIVINNNFHPELFPGVFNLFVQVLSKEALTEKERLRAESMEKDSVSEVDSEIAVSGFLIINNLRYSIMKNLCYSSYWELVQSFLHVLHKYSVLCYSSRVKTIFIDT